VSVTLVAICRARASVGRDSRIGFATRPVAPRPSTLPRSSSELWGVVSAVAGSTILECSSKPTSPT
jgi:hypothetical protein